MTSPGRISRRAVLRGLGTAVALPWLDAMTPALCWADEKKDAPRRMAFVYVPNGMHMADWTPAVDGADFEMPYIMEPLKALKDDVTVFTGLAQATARPNGDGPGDHARSLASFLTGTQAKKTHGADIKAGVSVDQLAAQKVGQRTKFPSIEIGCEPGPQSGNCDSGYSCAYSANISWRTETTPVAKEIDPRLVFERLFSAGNGNELRQSRAKRERYNHSILDFVLEDANSLKNKLGVKDQRKMEEYLSSVRELEVRIARAEREAREPAPVAPAPVPSMAKPSGIPKEYGEHIDLMSDLLVLAFQADLTRVATFVLANEGSNRSYPFLKVPEGHHEVSHHGKKKEKQDKIREINRFHATHFAHLLEKLKAVAEGERTLLDNSMIVYGSGISDGDRHNHDDLPIMLAGKAGGTIKAGRHVRLGKETPLNNLYLAMLDRMQAPADHLGDSTGKLDLMS